MIIRQQPQTVRCIILKRSPPTPPTLLLGLPVRELRANGETVKAYLPS